jgi:hypothetical protein
MPCATGCRQRDEGRDSAAKLVSTSRRRLEVEEEGLELRVMWQQSRGEWGKVLCGLPRFAFLLSVVAGRSPRAGCFCQSEWPDLHGLDRPARVGPAAGC